MPTVDHPVVLHAEFTARPGSEDEVMRLIGDYAECVRDEPGNIVFDVYRRADSLADFFVFEVYRDQEAFDAHLRADAGTTFNARLADHIVGEGSTLSFLSPASVSGWRP
ncbi:putative quinol monooxygenase [Microbacterium sp. KNMS]